MHLCKEETYSSFKYIYEVTKLPFFTLPNCEASPDFAVLSFILGRAGSCNILCRIWKTMERRLETRPQRRCGSCTKLCVSFYHNFLFNYHPNTSSRSTSHAAPQDRELNGKSALLVPPAFPSVEV
jgi:hypothetical protein